MRFAAWFTSVLALVLGCLLAPASSQARPIGMVEEFGVGGWAYSLAPGPDGNVWFSFDRDPVRTGDTAIGRITPRGQVTLFEAGLGAHSGPGAIALGPDGNLWFADDGKPAAIGRVTPGGKITEFSAGLNAGSRPGEIVPGPDGNLWFTDTGMTPAIGRVTPQGTIAEFSAGMSTKGVPTGIIAGPDGNLWFGDRAGALLGRVTPAGSIVELGSPVAAPGVLGGPVLGADGDVWLVGGGAQPAIARVAPSGAIAEFDHGLRSASLLLGPLTAAPDGNVWFAVRGQGRGPETAGSLKVPNRARPITAIGRITPAGEIAQFSRCLHSGPPFTGPNSLTAGPDGNVWFTSVTTRSLPNIGTPPAIGRVTPSGEITEFRAGMTYASTPDGIIAGPDGALWFSDRETHQIGRIVPPSAPPNTFIVRPARPARRSGAVTVRVAVPGRGILTLEQRGLLSSRNRLTRVEPRVAIATAPSCGETSIPIRLRGVALSRLLRHGSIRLKARVSLTPADGSTHTEAAVIGIGLRRR
jgi:streptogramin lyase